MPTIVITNKIEHLMGLFSNKQVLRCPRFDILHSLALISHKDRHEMLGCVMGTRLTRKTPAGVFSQYIEHVFQEQRSRRNVYRYRSGMLVINAGSPGKN